MAEERIPVVLTKEKKEEKAETQTVILGPTTIRGEIQGDENIVVEGRLEGKIELTKDLIVKNTGIVKAEVKVNNAVVEGVVVGNIKALEKVEISSTGRMVGDIYSKRVVIQEGAAFKGKIDMGEEMAGEAKAIQEKEEKLFEKEREEIVFPSQGTLKEKSTKKK